MATDDEPLPPDEPLAEMVEDSPQRSRDKAPAPQPGMSPLTKFLLLFAGLGALMIVGCCGVFIYFVSHLDKAQVTDPATIRAETAKMIEFEIPQELEPEIMVDLWFMKMARYAEPNDGQNSLMLMGIHPMMNGNKNFRQGIEQGFRQPNSGAEQDFILVSSEIETIDVRGKPVQFEFRKGKTPAGVEMREVNAIVEGKHGMVMLMLRQPETKYDRAEIDAMIRSIK